MKKVLIVEDEPELLNLIEQRMANAGYNPVLAQNGREGLERIQEGMPDLIITDVLMPVMDGYHFYQQIKKNKSWSQIPVLVLTARGKMEDTFKVIGVDEFVVKPINGHDLINKVEGLLARPKQVVKAKSGMRVLVAGNDSETVENMVTQLKKAGCHTDLVESGSQVISKAVLFLPSVIIMEVQLDEMDSPQIIDVLRKMPQFEKIPILLYSYYRLSELGSEDVRQRALSVDAHEQACMEAGATKYLGRYSENSFIKAIQKYLS